MIQNMPQEGGRSSRERSRLTRSALAVAMVVLLGCASTPGGPLRGPATSRDGLPADAPPQGTAPAPGPAVAAAPAVAADPANAAEPLAGPFRGVDDFCRSLLAPANSATCSALTDSVEGPKTLAQPEGPFREARLFQVGASASWHDVVLGIRTDRGWFFPNPESQADLALYQQLDGPHRIHVEPKQIAIERRALPVLVFRYLSNEYDATHATDEGSSEGEIRCTVAEDGVPRCASRRVDLGRQGKVAR